MGVNLRKVAVIGCGFVGSSSAFALMMSGLFSEMVLIDADREKAEGEALGFRKTAQQLPPEKGTNWHIEVSK